MFILYENNNVAPSREDAANNGSLLATYVFKILEKVQITPFKYGDNSTKLSTLGPLAMTTLGTIKPSLISSSLHCGPDSGRILTGN